MNKYTRKIVGMITVMAVAIAGVVMPDMWILPGSGSPEVAKAAVTEVNSWGELKDALAGGGDIKLTDNVTADSNSQRLEVPSGKTVTLDLNGHKIDRSFTSASSATANGYVIEVEGTLTLKDTSVSQTGVITRGHTNTGGGVYVSDGGSFTMNGGTISKNKASSQGGGVYVDHGNFTMNRGTISENEASSQGGGVYVDHGSFTMNGESTISENKAGSCAGVHVEEGSFIMKSGTITENKATGVCGGVYVKNGTFTMDAGTISNNEANQYGGGVYVYGERSNKSEFTMNGGTISENKATSSDGGGVYVSQTRFNMIGGTIKGNSAKDNGGGVSVVDSSEFTMKGGTIEENWATDRSGHGGGVCVNGSLNNGSSFTMNRGTIRGNWATGSSGVGGGVSVASNNSFSMNGGTIDSNEAMSGGGVSVLGIFSMIGGEIIRNTASGESLYNGEGGGVYVPSGSTFTMTGGTISGNKANTRGGGIYADGTFNVSGTPVVEDNKFASGSVCNVQFAIHETLSYQKTINITGPMSIGARIYSMPYVGAGIDATIAEGNSYTLDADMHEYFLCDNPAHASVFDSSTNKLVIGTKISATGVTLNRSAAEVKVGNTISLTATVAPDNASYKTVKWKSDNTDIATIDASGKVTGVKTGTATITATAVADSVTASCVVTVKSSGGGYTPSHTSPPATYVPVSTIPPTATPAPTVAPVVDSKVPDFSKVISEIVDAPEGSKVVIDMGIATTVPAEVLSALAGRDVDIVLDMGGGVTWTINGKDISSVTGAIDFGVLLGTSDIPVEVMNNVTGEKYGITLHLNHSGRFGFKAVMTVPIRKQDAGLIANLFYYNPDKGRFEFVSSGVIDDDGNVGLDFNHASDYAIVIDDHSLEKQEITSTVNKRSMKLTWDAVLGATDYTVYQSKDGKWVKIKTTAGTFIKIKNLKNDKKYKFTVKANINGHLTKAYRLNVYVCYTPVLKAGSKKGRISLSWTKVNNAKKYRILKFVDGKWKKLKDTSKTSHVINDAKPEKKFRYAVRAYVDGKWTPIGAASTAKIR